MVLIRKSNSNNLEYNNLCTGDKIIRAEITHHNGFRVVRDDLVVGGTKYRVLCRLLKDIPCGEAVYPADPFGYGQLALARSCFDHGKEATLFVPESLDFTNSKVFLETQKYSNVTYRPVSECWYQGELLQMAEAYSNASSDRYLFPIGFNTLDFLNELKNIALSMPIEKEPEEVWALAGSGLLVQALRLAWPNTKINAVNLGFPHVQIVGADKVFCAPEKPHEKALSPPPYPSSEYYDAKIWQFANRYGSDGALIWNVA